jgi:hypothetical protein
MATLNGALHYFRLLLAGLGDGVKRVFHLVLCEQAKEAPEPSAASILVLALSGVVAFIGPWRAYREFAKGDFRGAITMEDTALSALYRRVNHKNSTIG